jgi:2'-5' RNA ligase
MANDTQTNAQAQKNVATPLRHKTYRSTVAVVPPETAWPPIQAIRRRHDRQFWRWMPHINLLYPFVPPADFPAALPLLMAACAQVHAGVITLHTVQYFLHASRRATLWLAPEPREALVALHSRLQAAFPYHDDLGRFPHGFTPHLSTGQADSPAVLQRLLPELQAAWQPVQFDLTAVAVLHREADRPFHVAHWLPLAGCSP